MAQCSDCKYAVHTNGIWYRCQINPPVFFKGERGSWPTVKDVEWCGKYEAAP